jgi:predicted transport protein
MRDVRNIGKHRIGETEFALRSPEQLARLQALLKASYLRNRK